MPSRPITHDDVPVPLGQLVNVAPTPDASVVSHSPTPGRVPGPCVHTLTAYCTVPPLVMLDWFASTLTHNAVGPALGDAESVADDGACGCGVGAQANVAWSARAGSANTATQPPTAMAVASATRHRARREMRTRSRVVMGVFLG